MQLNVAVLQQTFDAVKSRADVFAKRFYERLFADYPHLKRIFRSVDIEEQQQKLIQSLVLIVKWLDSPERLTPYLQELGARHFEYRVQPDDYESFVATYVTVLGETVGKAWNKECETAWRDALHQVVEIMIQGAGVVGSASVAPAHSAPLQTASFQTTPVHSAHAHSDQIHSASSAAVMERPVDRQEPAMISTVKENRSPAVSGGNGSGPGQENLYEELDRLNAILEQLPVNLLLADREFTLIYMNQASRTTLKKLEHLLPKPVDRLIGEKIDIFHKHPQHQRKILNDPRNLPRRAQIQVGVDTLELIISAVYSRGGDYIGPMVAWSVITDRVKLGDDFERDVKAVAQIVTASAVQTQASAKTMAATAEETARQAQVVAAASQQATRNVETVSSSAAQLSASISEIARYVQDASKMTGQAVKDADNADTTIKQLGDASSQIGQVIKVITSIAQQTNLLALNATIEAARAGEAGKGFAVVANEVKELARQTAKATEEISQKIEAIQNSTRVAVSDIGSIGGIINRINEIAATISVAIEEQTAATSEISRNVAEAARGTADVNDNISGVSQAADETGKGANEILVAAEGLALESAQLDRVTTTFLQRVRHNT